MKLPGTLPLGATLIGALYKPFSHPAAFVLAALPFCLGEWALAALQHQLPYSSWPGMLTLLNTAVLWTLMVTNWHRLILLGEKPNWRWGKRELRYAVIAFVVVISVLVPPLLIGFLVQGFGTLLLARIESLPPLIATPVVVVLGLLPLALLLFAVAKSTPLWLWLPSEALGRDEGYDDFCTMAHGNRARMILVNGIALIANLLLVYAGKAFCLPAAAMTIVETIGGALQIGTVSLCYGHLSGKLLVTDVTTETAP